VERRLIVEQFDPEVSRPGGIDTCIRGLVRYCPPNIDLRIVGVDAVGSKRLGEWAQYEIGGRTVEFMPVARLDPANTKKRRPHSVWLTQGLIKYRPARDADVINTHRLNVGAAVIRLYPGAELVQYLHGSGIADLKSSSGSYFRHGVLAYRWLERHVIPRAADVVVFNTFGAERLRSLSPRVRFSPNWYDPTYFFPSATESAVKSRILWPARIEPQKNPELAIDVMGLLPAHYTLTVAGDGSLNSAMQLRARNSPAVDRIEFAGAIPKSDIGAVMRSHDLMLMTSRFEGYPYAVVEALASGLPVVTTPGGEPNGLVQDGVNGARVPADRAELFVSAVDLASTIAASAAAESVIQLSAVTCVPDVMTIPR
jgi:glycosyltransferase involved in cell wall biosynthesis